MIFSWSRNLWICTLHCTILHPMFVEFWQIPSIPKPREELGHWELMCHHSPFWSPICLLLSSQAADFAKSSPGLRMMLERVDTSDATVSDQSLVRREAAMLRDEVWPHWSSSLFHYGDTMRHRVWAFSILFTSWNVALLQSFLLIKACFAMLRP